MTSWFVAYPRVSSLARRGRRPLVVRRLIRSETHRERPSRVRRGRRAARGGAEDSRHVRPRGRGVARPPSEGGTSDGAPPRRRCRDGDGGDDRDAKIGPGCVEDETSTSSSTRAPAWRSDASMGVLQSSRRRRPREGVSSPALATPRRPSPAPLISPLKDLPGVLASTEGRGPPADGTAPRAAPGAREPGHALAVPIAEELERLVTERDDAVKELEERKRRRRRARSAATPVRRRTNPLERARRSTSRWT